MVFVSAFMMIGAGEVTSHDFASVTFPELPFGAAREARLHNQERCRSSLA